MDYPVTLRAIHELPFQNAQPKPNMKAVLDEAVCEVNKRLLSHSLAPRVVFEHSLSRALDPVQMDFKSVEPFDRRLAILGGWILPAESGDYLLYRGSEITPRVMIGLFPDGNVTRGIFRGLRHCDKQCSGEFSVDL